MGAVISHRWFDRPIFIISCNRSGSTLLFRTLSGHPDVWSLYVEGKRLFHRYFPVHGEHGDRVFGLPSESVLRAFCEDLFRRAHNKERFRDSAPGRLIPLKLIQRPLGRLYKHAPLRLVEKTPSNCFRVPFLARAFPDAKFVFLVRRGEAAVSSLMEGWKRWSGLEEGEAWSYEKWHYLVPPGWRETIEHRLEEICAHQWVTSNETAWEDLQEFAAGRAFLVRFEQLRRRPREWFEAIRQFCELRKSTHYESLVERTDQRVFTTGGSPPRREKWRDLHLDEVESVRPRMRRALERFYGEVGAGPLVSADRPGPNA